MPNTATYLLQFLEEKMWTRLFCLQVGHLTGVLSYKQVTWRRCSGLTRPPQAGPRSFQHKLQTPSAAVWCVPPNPAVNQLQLSVL